MKETNTNSAETEFQRSQRQDFNVNADRISTRLLQSDVGRYRPGP